MAWAMTESKEKKKHAREIIHGAQLRDPFFQFQGASEDNIILISPESKSETSTTIFRIVTDLVGDGVTGNADLSDNRDELNFVPFSVPGDVIANSIKSPVQKIMDKTAAGAWRRESKKALEKWLIRKTVRPKFYALSHDCTNVVCTNAAGAVIADPAALVVGDTFSTATLDEMISRAKNGWNDGTEDHPELVPFVIERKTEKGVEIVGEFFPVFILPQSLKSLNDDPIFQAEQSAKANAGLFSSLSGFAGVYRNAVIIEVGRDTVRRPGGIRSDADDFGAYTGFEAKYAAGDATVTEINIMLGCGAGALPFDNSPTYDEDPTEDNGRKVVAFIEEYYGFKKVRWVGETAAEQASIYHNKDYGVIAGVSTIS